MIKAPKGKILLDDYVTREYVRPSGIVLPQNVFHDNTRIMIVRSVGAGVDPDLKVGARVITKTFQGFEVKHDGESIRTCVPEDILLILD